MTTPARIFALIVSAGKGVRMGLAQPKQYSLVAGKPLVQHTVQAFLACNTIHQGLVVTAPSDDFWTDTERARIAPFQVQAVGGATRALSVLGGLRALLALGAQAEDWVLVHDAARCLITTRDIEKLIAACHDDAVGGLLASPVVDTLKLAQHEPDGSVRSIATVARSDKWQAQTPQMFRIGLVAAAIEQAGDYITDEASAIEALGLKPRLVAASCNNMKITYPADLVLAEQSLNPGLSSQRNAKTFPVLRIGEGWDSHALGPQRPLILGGVTIPYERGLVGHSDADVLLHAVTDAVLGAAALGDIGRHFADSDAKNSNAASHIFLRHALQLVRAKSYQLINVDATIIAQAPKLAPHMAAINASLAAMLELAPDCVNVKAKTAEKLGPVGEGKSMEARAVVLLMQA